MRLEDVRRGLETKIIEFPVKNKFFFNSLVGNAFGLPRPFVCDEVHINGLRNIKKNGGYIPAPLMILLKHESYQDAIDLGSKCSLVPHLSNVKIIGRDDYFHSSIFSPSFNWIFNKTAGKRYMIPIVRSWIKDASKKEKIEMKKLNNQSLEQATDEWMSGKSIIILPEGTTRNNGEFVEVKSGAWRISHKVVDDKIYVINTLPVGNTVDWLSGNGKKHLVFANVGPPFYYQPAPWEGEIEGEGVGKYQCKDKENYSRIIKDNFINLHTYTASQIGGMYLNSLLMKGRREFKKEELGEKINFFVERVGEIEDGRPVYVDPVLLENPKRRIDNLYENLLAQGYISESGGLVTVTDKMNIVPGERKYKNKNRLRYMTNRFLSAAENRITIRGAIENTFDIPLKDYVIE